MPTAVQIASLAVTGVSYIATGKSLSDHAVSLAAEQDCALHRVLVDGVVCHDFDATAGTALAAASDAAIEEAILGAETLVAPLPAAGPHPGDAFAHDATAASPVEAPLVLAVLVQTEDVTRPAPAGDELFLSLGTFATEGEAAALRARHADVPTTVAVALVLGRVQHAVAAGPFGAEEAVRVRLLLAERGLRTDPPRPLCNSIEAPPACGFGNAVHVLAPAVPEVHSAKALVQSAR